MLNYYICSVGTDSLEWFVDKLTLSLVGFFVGVTFWSLTVELHEFSLKLGNFLLKSLFLLLWSSLLPAINVGLGLPDFLSESLLLGLELSIKLLSLLFHKLLSFRALFFDGFFVLLALFFLLFLWEDVHISCLILEFILQLLLGISMLLFELIDLSFELIIDFFALSFLLFFGHLSRFLLGCLKIFFLLFKHILWCELIVTLFHWVATFGSDLLDLVE